MKTEFLQHNGVNISEYPSDDWLLAPFPRQKSPIYCNDNLATVNRPYFLEDVNFLECLNAAKSAWGENKRDISWRLHVFLWAASSALASSDDQVFVELGTGRGYMVRALAKSGIGKKLRAYCFDSFTPNLPISADANSADIKNRFSYIQAPSELNSLHEDIQSFNSISTRRFSFVQGLLPNSLRAYLGTFGKIDLIHIDLNHAESEIRSLELLAPLIRNDTTLLFDDTGAPGSEEQWKAHLRFLRDLGKSPLYLPTGQCLAL